MNRYTITDKRHKQLEAEIIDLVKIVDPRGNLTVAEGRKDVSFDIRRVYWVHDVSASESRGEHAHEWYKEFLIASSGSFHVTFDNGKEKTPTLLNHPHQGLFVDIDTWRTLDDFSSGAVCLVLASELFDEEDYIRNYHSFTEYIKNRPDV